VPSRLIARNSLSHSSTLRPDSPPPSPASNQPAPAAEWQPTRERNGVPDGTLVLPSTPWRNTDP